MSVSTKVNLKIVGVTKITALESVSNKPEELAVAVVPPLESLSVSGVVAHVQGSPPESNIVQLLAEMSKY